MGERDIKPDNLTEAQWESAKMQADEWGARFEIGFPGTQYHKDTMLWDYSGNSEAVSIFGNKGDCCIFTPVFAHFNKR